MRLDSSIRSSAQFHCLGFWQMKQALSDCKLISKLIFAFVSPNICITYIHKVFCCTILKDNHRDIYWSCILSRCAEDLLQSEGSKANLLKLFFKLNTSILRIHKHYNNELEWCSRESCRMYQILNLSLRMFSWLNYTIMGAYNCTLSPKQTYTVS